MSAPELVAVAFFIVAADVLMAAATPGPPIEPVDEFR